MHEVSVVSALLNEVNGITQAQVRRIRVEIGALSCVDPYRFQFCFDMVKQEAGLGDAELVIVSPPGVAKCNRCGCVFELIRLGVPCDCGSYDYTVKSGQQVLLTEIEFD